MIKVGSDFSGVGAFDQALILNRIEYKTVFSCDMDKYARQSYIANYGKPEYYPENVYDRKIPLDPLDIYMTSPPCQSFSLAGKRNGKDSENGVLFFNSHEFIKQNKPKFFIFENVKGLLSDDDGKTFSEWCNMLGGKSVNGNPVIFPYEDSVPYHIYHKVLNAKKYGVPQNRERVFIIGIRYDVDNTFTWPKEERLTKKLADVLEIDVDEKYFLSDRMIQGFVTKKTNDFKGRFQPKNGSESHANCITTNTGSRITDNYIFDSGYINQDTQASQVHSKENSSPTISAGSHGYANGDVKIGAMRGRNPDNPSDRTTGLPTEQRIEINKNGTSNALTTVQKDNLVISDRIRRLTPLECFRLMDFPDSFKFVVSDTQLYKQAGNSIVRAVLAKIINKLNV